MASPTDHSRPKMSLKLMVHKKKKRVIFAEAGSDFVNTLFSFMTLPLGTIVRVLLGKQPDEKLTALGSLQNVYKSLLDLPENYFSTEESKYMMLNTRSTSYDHCSRNLKLNIDDTKPRQNFVCSKNNCVSRSRLFSTCNFARCRDCGGLMNREIQEKKSVTGSCRDDGGLYVSDVSTFIVTDDLLVMPNTSGSIIKLLSDLGITDSSQLEERTFDIGQDQILTIMQGALLFNLSLTSLVFPHFNRDLVSLRRKTSVQPLVSSGAGTGSKKMTLKVTLQKSTSKFLFAEGEEDFVEFVFSFLEIPLGTVIGKLMNGVTCVESLDNLFASISGMRVGRDMKSQDVKDMLLGPQLEHKYLSQHQIFPLNVSQTLRTSRCEFDPKMINFYLVDNFSSDVQSRYKRTLISKDPSVNGSYLKAAAKFMLMDDLVITPLSPFSTIALLNKLKVPLDDIEEHELSFGIQEGLKILKAAINSSANCLSTLTYALLQGVKEIRVKSEQ